MSQNQWVYQFNQDQSEGSSAMKNLLGGKGANLAEMSSMGLPVPPGFTVTTQACLEYERNGGELWQAVKSQCLKSMANIEKLTGKKFGDHLNPLLFSVRSGARVSMPGMMDTVLNLGLNEQSVEGLAKQTGSDRFAWDSYRRFIQMYANVVLGMNMTILENTLENLKEVRGVHDDRGLSGEDFKELCSVYLDLILQEQGNVFPSDPKEQLWKAIAAVFDSWKNPRAVKYRELHGFCHSWGTAVNIQAMVFGNRGDDSGTGVCFTRDPSTGQKRFFGEFLMNAQGEDVVAGLRTPGPLNEESKTTSNSNEETLQERAASSYKELVSFYQKLEAHYKDMQDIEFTIEQGKLYILQTRSGKRTTAAALKIAIDFVHEGLISKQEALMRVRPEDLNQLLHRRLDEGAEKTLVATGLPASPGAASGVLAFCSDQAVEMAESGQKVLLVRRETSPDDINGMIVSAGILTARGGDDFPCGRGGQGYGAPLCGGMPVSFY